MCRQAPSTASRGSTRRRSGWWTSTPWWTASTTAPRRTSSSSATSALSASTSFVSPTAPGPSGGTGAAVVGREGEVGADRAVGPMYGHSGCLCPRTRPSHPGAIFLPLGRRRRRRPFSPPPSPAPMQTNYGCNFINCGNSRLITTDAETAGRGPCLGRRLPFASSHVPPLVGCLRGRRLQPPPPSPPSDKVIGLRQTTCFVY